MKIAVLFVAHKYNESSIIGYNRLVNELDNNIYDVIWCVPFDVKVDETGEILDYELKNEKGKFKISGKEVKKQIDESLKKKKK